MADKSDLLIQIIERLAKMEEISARNAKRLDEIEKEVKDIQKQLIIIKQDPVIAIVKKIAMTSIVVGVTLYLNSIFKK